MVRGCAIFSQLLLLYVVRDTWGLRCYVGVLGQPQSRTSLGRICGVIFSLPCRGVGYYDQFNANRIVRGGKYCGVVFELPCEGKGFYDQFNADEIWKSSPDYSTEESYPECFQNPFPEDRSLQSTTTTTQRMTTTKEGKLGPLLPDMKKTRKPGTVEGAICYVFMTKGNHL
ncbi:hypothetical protein RB195_016082 [Necator americanus]|uniref:Uncharacterized protein n=1 Tax=Necator americanus TaxID=51031 RepID=A0ABR1E839_NECAM